MNPTQHSPALDPLRKTIWDLMDYKQQRHPDCNILIIAQLDAKCAGQMRIGDAIGARLGVIGPENASEVPGVIMDLLVMYENILGMIKVQADSLLGDCATLDLPDEEMKAFPLIRKGLKEGLSAADGEGGDKSQDLEHSSLLGQPMPLMRPEEPGWYWVRRSQANPMWIVKKVQFIDWDVSCEEWEVSSSSVLAETAGGEWRRCDMVNTPEDSGDRYFRMKPPVWTPEGKGCA